MRIAPLVGVAIVLGIGAVDMHYGTISPRGIIKQKAREAAAKQGGFVAALSLARPEGSPSGRSFSRRRVEA